MYRVFYYDDIYDQEPVVIHEPNTFGEKLLSGRIKKALNTVSTFEFTISVDSVAYQKVRLLKGLVKVVNTLDNNQEFFGRIYKPVGSMDASGLFAQNFLAEDFLAYLNDSNQMFARVPNRGMRDYFERVIQRHNSVVEPHKRFKIGRVTVDSGSDIPTRYIGYETTWETLREFFIGRFGGYLQLRHEPDGLYLDYLKEVGHKSNTPIKIGENLKEAEREVDVSELITRIVPIGADKEDATIRDDDSGQYVIRERIDIKSVNNGIEYLEDKELIETFGVIQRTVNWTDISAPNILKIRGQQYMDNQRVAIANWRVSAVNLNLIDKRYDKFEVGNTHPIINPPLSSVEELQIIELELDIINVQSLELSVGADQQTLSAFQLQQQEAQKSMEAAVAEIERKRKEEQRLTNEINLTVLSLLTKQGELKAYQDELNLAQGELARVNAELADPEGINKSSLELRRTQLNSQISNLQTSISTINKEITELETKSKELQKELEEVTAE